MVWRRKIVREARGYCQVARFACLVVWLRRMYVCLVLLQTGLEMWGRQPCKIAALVGSKTCQEVGGAKAACFA